MNAVQYKLYEKLVNNGSNCLTAVQLFELTGYSVRRIKNNMTRLMKVADEVNEAFEVNKDSGYCYSIGYYIVN